EIDAGAAQARLLIERGARRHVVGYIGDVNLQLEVVVRQQANRDRVVEVARGFAVNGDDGQATEVAAALQFGSRDNRGCILRFLQDGSGEVVRKMELADGDLYVHAEVVLAAENFDDSSAGILRGRGPIGDFYVHDDALQVVPVGAAGDFVAQDAFHGLFF